MDGGDVVFHFKGNTSDVESKAKGLGSTIKGIAGGITKAFAGAVTVGATALTGLVAKSVSAMGEVEQAIGGTTAVFGDYAQTIQDEASEAFENAGLSAEEYMATANKIGSLMQGAGISQAEAVDLTTQAMQRASDVASIMGIDTTDAMEAITGAAKGNFTMMDNLGVAMNATTLEAYALSKGITTSYNEMSNAEKVGLAYEMFLEKTSDYAGNYARENDTLAGSLNTAKKAFSNFMSGAGDIEDVISSFINAGNQISKGIVEMLPKITDGLVQLINGLIPQIPVLVQALLPGVVDGAIAIINGLIQSLPQIMQMLAEMLPTIIQSLIDGLILIINTLAEMLPELLPIIVDAILGIIPILIDNLPALLNAGAQLLGGLIAGIINSIPILFARIEEIGVKIIEFFKNIDLKEIGMNLLKGLWNGIKNASEWVIEKIKGIGSSILSTVKGIFGIHSPSTEFEYIGKMNMVGMENGLEDEKATLQDTFDSMFDLSPSLYGSSSLNMSPNVDVTVNNNMQYDALGQLVNEVKTFSGGSKNDYNYGMGGA